MVLAKGNVKMDESINESVTTKSDQMHPEDRKLWIRNNNVPPCHVPGEADTSGLVWQQIVKHRCILFLLISTVLSSMHALMVRYVKEDIHATQVAFIRLFFQLGIPVPVMIYKDISPKPETRIAFVLLVARGVFGAFAITCLFNSFYYMPVGDATAIVFGSPVFVGIFAKIVMKEAFGIIETVLVFTAICGVMLISQPPFLFTSKDVTANDPNNTYPHKFVGAVFALCACICVSFTVVIMRKMGTIGVNSFKIVFYYAFIASAVTSMLTTGLGVWTIPPCGFVRFALVVMGTFNCVSQCLVTYALSVEKAVFVSILRANEVICAFILEYLLFHDYPDYLSLFGVFLVISASVLASLRRMWMLKKDNKLVEGKHSPSYKNSSPDAKEP